MFGKVIYTDVDGTLVDFATPFHDWMEERGIEARDGYHLDSHFHVAEVFGLDSETALQHLGDFCQIDHFAKLQPLPHAGEAIARFANEGWDIVVVTACAHDEITQSLRCSNMWDHFSIPKEKIHFSGILGSKRSILESFPMGFWVDDLLVHAREGSEAGHHSILIDKPYNEKLSAEPHPHDDKIVRLPGWKEIEAHIREVFSYQ